ncbi:hypothetical protein KC460_02165 [Candidatus Dependentiae bacterium]|nr:hypothetical protein [Candidatus Dependentiae bacterium]
MGSFTTAFSNGYSTKKHRGEGDCKEKKNLNTMTRENLISYANDLEKQLEVEKNNKSGKSLTILGGRLLTYGFKFGCSVMLFLFFHI